MRDKAHTLITKKVIDILNVPDDISKILLDNIIKPDIEAQENPILFKHHCYIPGFFGCAPESIKRCFLKCSPVSIAYALHFAQDICVPAHCSNAVHEYHMEIEEKIDEMVDDIIKLYVPMSHFIDDIKKYAESIASMNITYARLYKKYRDADLLIFNIITALDFTYLIMRQYLNL